MLKKIQTLDYKFSSKYIFFSLLTPIIFTFFWYISYLAGENKILNFVFFYLPIILFWGIPGIWFLIVDIFYAVNKVNIKPLVVFLSLIFVGLLAAFLGLSDIIVVALILILFVVIPIYSIYHAVVATTEYKKVQEVKAN